MEILGYLLVFVVVFALTNFLVQLGLGKNWYDRGYQDGKAWYNFKFSGFSIILWYVKIQYNRGWEAGRKAREEV